MASRNLFRPRGVDRRPLGGRGRRSTQNNVSGLRRRSEGGFAVRRESDNAPARRVAGRRRDENRRSVQVAVAAPPAYVQ